MTRHNGLLPTPTCYILVVYVADLLATQRGGRQLVTELLRETGVMDFSLNRTPYTHTHTAYVDMH